MEIRLKYFPIHIILAVMLSAAAPLTSRAGSTSSDLVGTYSCANDQRHQDYSIDGPLQGADRTSATSPRLRCSADRGCDRRGGPEPDAGGWTSDVVRSQAVIT